MHQEEKKWQKKDNKINRDPNERKSTAGKTEGKKGSSSRQKNKNKRNFSNQIKKNPINKMGEQNIFS